MKKDNTKQFKKQVNKNLSSVQKMFTAAIDYKALEKALNDPQVIAILNKVKL